MSSSAVTSTTATATSATSTKTVLVKAHEFKTTTSKVTWLVAVYAMAAYTYGTHSVLDSTAGPGKTGTQLAPSRAMVMTPIISSFASASFFKGRYSHAMVQASFSSMYAAIGISKIVNRDLDSLISLTLNGSDTLHTLVFWLDAILNLAYAIPFVIENRRIRKAAHALIMTVHMIIYGTLVPSTWDNGASGVPSSYRLAQFAHTFLAGTIANLHVGGAHFNDNAD